WEVARLEAAVADPAVRGGGDGPGQRLDQPGRLGHRKRLPGQALRQAAAFDVLQREDRYAVVLADLVDLYDVRVVQAGDRLGFRLEARPLLGAGVAAGEDHLQGDDPVELELTG